MMAYCSKGGGPAGLVSAKVLLHDFPAGTFEPVIFERKHGVGGLWNVSTETSGDDMFDPEMPTNISRYMCSFSDLAWESVDLGKDSSDLDVTLPMFPKACHVKRYLETYSKWYIPTKNINLGCNVTQATPYDHNGVTIWSVDWQMSSGHSFTSPIGTEWAAAKTGPGTYQASFDYLVVASGFFAVPRMPNVQGIEEFSTKAKLRHSSKLRSIQDDLVDGGSGKIVVVGGSMSGVEAAAAAAFQLSSSKYSPGKRKDYSRYTVHHLISRPFWGLPSYVLRKAPSGDAEGSKRSSPSFLPEEMAGNDLSGRAEGAVSYRPSRQISQTSMKATNTRISQFLGTKQATLGDGLLSFEGERMNTQLPWIAISSTYAEFVRSGDIKVHLGSAVEMKSTTLEARGNIQFQLNDVALLIAATGFDPNASLSFLPSGVLQSMDYKPHDNYEPLSLDEFAISNAR